MALAVDAAAVERAETLYRGTCDASAAAVLDDEHFVVASDEDDDLRVYRRGQPEPVATLPLAHHLGATAESDLEGAARVGGRIYWIGSHGRSAKGKGRRDRHRFFATEIDFSTLPPSLKPPVAVHRDLLRQLMADASLGRWRLSEAARLAPEAPGGLNIEGLAATADGRLLIGFRNPVRDGMALVVRLDNPDEVMTGGAAKFGPPVALDLGGRGVRSIDRMESQYLIVAGPVADRGDFALYRWSGQAPDAPRLLPEAPLGTLRPEAIVVWPNGRQVQVLSDDGGVATGGVACKDRPRAAQAFRSIEFSL